MLNLRDATARFRAIVDELRKDGVPEREIIATMALAYEAEPIKQALAARPHIGKAMAEIVGSLRQVIEMAAEVERAGRPPK